MKTLSAPPEKTMADIIAALGDVPLFRIRATPPPGTATAADVIRLRESPERRLCELVDGILVEKAMGAKESILAMQIGHRLLVYVEEHNLGVVLGADGMLTLFPGRVRIPDVSFIPWEQIPGQQWPDNPMPEIPPDLAVEVLSPSNTPGEIRLKIREYFQAGTRLVWVIDPKKQNARSYTDPSRPVSSPSPAASTGGRFCPDSNCRCQVCSAHCGKGRRKEPDRPLGHPRTMKSSSPGPRFRVRVSTISRLLAVDSLGPLM